MLVQSSSAAQVLVSTRARFPKSRCPHCVAFTRFVFCLTMGFLLIRGRRVLLSCGFAAQSSENSLFCGPVGHGKTGTFLCVYFLFSAQISPCESFSCWHVLMHMQEQSSLFHQVLVDLCHELVLSPAFILTTSATDQPHGSTWDHYSQSTTLPWPSPSLW